MAAYQDVQQQGYLSARPGAGYYVSETLPLRSSIEAEASNALRLRSDRQGDLLLERAMAYYLENGEVDRHLRKVRPVYQRRRDLLTDLLHETFGDQVSFTVPQGGIAT